MTESGGSQDKTISFGTADEFRTRPRFLSDILVPKAGPQKIIGSYRLTEPVRCGLQGCQQSHQHGYVVLLAAGTETNTGWDCGLDHFGVGFLEMRVEYDRIEREASRRTALGRMIGEFQHFRDVVQTLHTRPYGGNWLLRNLRRFYELYPKPLLDVLVRHAENGKISVYNLPADVAIELELESSSANRRADTRPESATLRGLRIFSLDIDNWPLFEIELDLNEFLALNPGDISFNDVVRWCHWAESLRSRLAQIEDLIDDGKVFFRRGNLKLLPLVAPDQKSREQLSWIVSAGDFAESRGPQPVAQKAWRRQLRRFIDAINK